MIKSWQDFIVEFYSLSPKGVTDRYKKSSRGEVVEGTEDQIEEILSKYVPWYDPINVKMPLYRSLMVGTTTKPYFAYKTIEPKKFVRKPPTTENYYNVIIDNSPNWVDYPKRSRSVMTHTVESKTRMYGNKVYRVIPLKENVICAYVSDDYWVSFDKLFKSWPFGKINTLNEFNQSLRNIFDLPKKDYTPNKLKELLSSNNLNPNIPAGRMKLYKESLIKIERKDGSFYNWIDKHMIPEYSDVELITYNNDTELPNMDLVVSGYEVWTDEKCLLVDDEILRKLWIKKKNPVD